LQQLQEENVKLTKQLHAAIREKDEVKKDVEYDMNVYQKERSEWIQKEKQYQNQVAVVRQKLSKVEVELKSLQQEKQDKGESSEQQKQAHVIVIKTLESENQSLRRQLSEIQEELVFERRRRRANSLTLDRSEVDKMIDELRTQIMTLSEEKEKLIEESENLAVLLSEQRTGNGVAPGPIGNGSGPPPGAPPTPPSSAKNKALRIPPRSSSATDMLTKNMISSQVGNLAAELLASQMMAKEQTELEKLREENKALVSYIVSTLDSINKIR
ncbi:hypothetical protein HK102_008686, partial [Quaeritorhiza haematococci]